MRDKLPQSPRWSALLMAGGESRRMGRDKATLSVRGEPLWRRQVRTLREAGFDEIIIARGQHARLGAGERGLIEVADAASGCGPLGGLVAGLRQASTRWILVLAVDLPLIPPVLLREMIEAAELRGAGVVPVIDGRFEPLAAVYSSSCLSFAEDCLARRQLSLQAMMSVWVSAGLMCQCEVSPLQRAYFRNVNTPEDLAEMERQFGER